MKQHLKHPLLWFGIALFVLFALVRLPMVLFASAIPAPVKTGDVTGNLWEGRIGQLGLGDQLLLQDVRWHWQPSALLHAQLAWQLDTRDGETPGQARAVLGMTGWRLEHVALNIPASPLFAQVKMLAPFQLGGSLQVRAQQIAAGKFDQLSMQLTDATSMVTPQANPFGNYLIHVAQGSGAPTWQITPQGGLLAINGSGQITNDGPKGQLSFTPTKGKEALFSSLLDRMGPGHTVQLGGQ
ncbi:type II secretion system protein N [Silvimonas sp.]|uniref:type II secretion system protein N n=1 Tax=Silvimonas sp. TaxID=2650811 RepID=UPI00284406B6|nr:type II secretion system protein N [Silvimonas sp.]MDR3428908.1 type II secretion system protein N [Silvimonas sp.]